MACDLKMTDWILANGFSSITKLHQPALELEQELKLAACNRGDQWQNDILQGPVHWKLLGDTSLRPRHAHVLL